jgi:UDP-N-acetylglucosamine--N-acetylmuramyl-(pentapeptide) pyrophosphoryl-undecaprenol N-acetylglucosamine transferase
VVSTTSEAHALTRSGPFATVHLPGPDAGRRGGLGSEARRRLVRASVEAASEAFAPDLFVADTFPSGPHGELAGLFAGSAKRALVRRHVRVKRADDPVLTAGLERYDLAIVADDPSRNQDAALPVPTVRVPAITMTEPHDALDRDAARERLNLPRSARAVLVTAGGGGDPEGCERAFEVGAAIARVAPDVVPVVAEGPLGQARRASDGAVRYAQATPIAPLLAAFDGAIAAAGYNTAHELAKAGVPAALFALERPFDDQAARIARFEAAGLSRALAGFGDDAVREALAWMLRAARPELATGGADRAADALLDLVTGRPA